MTARLLLGILRVFLEQGKVLKAVNRSVYYTTEGLMINMASDHDENKLAKYLFIIHKAHLFKLS